MRTTKIIDYYHSFWEDDTRLYAVTDNKGLIVLSEDCHNEYPETMSWLAIRELAKQNTGYHRSIIF